MVGCCTPAQKHHNVDHVLHQDQNQNHQDVDQHHLHQDLDNHHQDIDQHHQHQDQDHHHPTPKRQRRGMWKDGGRGPACHLGNTRWGKVSHIGSNLIRINTRIEVEIRIRKSDVHLCQWKCVRQIERWRCLPTKACRCCTLRKTPSQMDVGLDGIGWISRWVGMI